MADKKIKVQLDVESNIEPTIANLKALKRQLKETAAGSAEFNKLSAQIRDLDDAIKDASATSDDFLGYLENASGPLGVLGKGIRNAEKNFSSFNAVLKASVIGLIATAVAGLVAAFNENEKAMKKIQPLLIAMERIFNGIYSAVEPLFDALLNGATKALPFVTKYFQVLYSTITATIQSIGKLGEAAMKLFKGDFSGALDSAKASVTDFSTNYNAAAKRFEEGAKEQTKTEKKNLEEQKKLREDAEKKRREDAEKLAERLKKEAEERKKILDDANKAEVDAYKESLSDRNREEFEAGLVLNERLAAIQKAGTGDREIVLEAYRKKVKEINDKYDKVDKDAADKATEDRLKLANDEMKFYLDMYAKIDELNKQRVDSEFATNQIIAQSWVDLGQNIANVFGSLINVFEQGSSAAKAFGIAQVIINAASSIGQILVNAKAAQFEYDKAIATGNAAILSSIPKLVNPVTAPIGIAEAAAGKAAIAGAVAGKAVLKTNTVLQVAAVGASSAAQVAAIISAKKSSASGGTAGGGASGGTSISTPSIASTPAPQIQSGQGVNATQQIGETIAGAQRPIRAYVISGEVSSQQALDRRTSRAATFTGG